MQLQHKDQVRFEQWDSLEHKGPEQPRTAYGMNGSTALLPALYGTKQNKWAGWNDL